MKSLLIFCVLSVSLLGAEAPASKAPPIDIAVVKPKAEAGDAKAQIQMGAAYFFGRGVKKNLDEAAKWYRMASDQRDPDGQFAYAALLANSGSKKDAREAVELYKQAAEKGHPGAMFYLGSFYYSGWVVGGMAQDPFLGAQWYEKAALAGHATAQLNIGALLTADGGPLKSNPVDGLAWLMIVGETGNKDATKQRDDVLKDVKPAVVQAAQARALQFKAEIERNKRAREQASK